MWIVVVTVSLLLFETVHCGGTIEVRLISYNFINNGSQSNLCCDVTTNSSCDACDPYIEIWLAFQNHFGTPVSNKEGTKQYNNTNNVDFGTTENAFNLSFSQFTQTYYLVFSVFNKNASVPVPLPSTPIIDEPSFHVGQGEPSSFSSSPPYTVRTVTGQSAEIRFEYKIKCDTYYYGSCNIYCRPVTGQYTCSQYGRRVCEHGWFGMNCTERRVDLTCKNTTCLHGSTCVDRAVNQTECMCTIAYTGKFCETLITTTTTTNSPTKPGTSPSTSFSMAQYSAAITKVSATMSQSTGSHSAGNVSHVTPSGSHSNVTQPAMGAVTFFAGFTLPTLVNIQANLNQSTFKQEGGKSDTSSDLTPIIIGSVVGLILLLAILIAIILALSKKKKHRKVTDSTSSAKPFQTDL